jgi:hypothetical protein
METTHELRQMKLGTMKHRGYTYKFCLDNYFLGWTFEYGVGGNLKLLMWMQNLHSQRRPINFFLFYRSSEDEQLLMT